MQVELQQISPKLRRCMYGSCWPLLGAASLRCALTPAGLLYPQGAPFVNVTLEYLGNVEASVTSGRRRLLQTANSATKVLHTALLQPRSVHSTPHARWPVLQAPTNCPATGTAIASRVPQSVGANSGAGRQAQKFDSTFFGAAVLTSGVVALHRCTTTTRT